MSDEINADFFQSGFYHGNEYYLMCFTQAIQIFKFFLSVCVSAILGLFSTLCRISEPTKRKKIVLTFNHFCFTFHPNTGTEYSIHHPFYLS